MKKFVFALIALFTMTVSASAMGYEQARNEALFLTDKMAYELNLTEEQYEAAYEINLDYLMGVNTVDDLYGAYWTHRNLDFSYILLDWQYRAFCQAAYFYRPIYWNAGYWHFGIYARYPHRDYFMYGRPRFYVEYRGGHSWRMNGGRSWYHGRRDWHRHDNGRWVGMRDGYRRGDYRNGYDNARNRSFGNGRSRVGMVNSNANRTRSFGSNNRIQNRNQGTRTFGGNRQNHNNGNIGNRGFGQRRSSTRTTVTRTPEIQRRNFEAPRTMNRNSFQRQSAPRMPRNNSAFQNRPSNRSFNNGGSFNNNRGSFGGNRGSFGGSRGSFGGGRHR